MQAKLAGQNGAKTSKNLDVIKLNVSKNDVFEHFSQKFIINTGKGFLVFPYVSFPFCYLSRKMPCDLTLLTLSSSTENG